VTGDDLDPALAFHGDREVSPELVDLAVNVRTAPPPAWLAAPIRTAISDLSAYPDQSAARAAVAAHHRRDPAEILLCAGAAQAFTLIAQAHAHAHARAGTHAPAGAHARAGTHVPASTRSTSSLQDPRSWRADGTAVVVHPQFTEPEAALRAAGVPVTRLGLRAETGFALAGAAPPDDADLVMIGNPTNPTSVLHDRDAIAAWARPGRILVVDEAFADTVPGEPGSLAARSDIPGLVVIRSLTKTWGLAGLRIGYLIAAPDLVERFARHQPLWPVSTPALAAAIACATPRARAAERAIAEELTGAREHLVARLAGIDGVTLAATPRSSFVLIRTAARAHAELRGHGFAVRRGDTFPGLGPDYLRVAVREPAVSDAFADALNEILAVR
jgi:histidinol-phosphate aminotransferase